GKEKGGRPQPEGQRPRPSPSSFREPRLADGYMAGNLVTLDMRTRAAWRQWLARHHALSPGIWLVRHKQHSGVKSMPYEDLVREALCFGWVDSLIKRLDDDRYAIKVTPRKPPSKWSDSNRKRWKELQA